MSKRLAVSMVKMLVLTVTTLASALFVAACDGECCDCGPCGSAGPPDRDALVLLEAVLQFGVIPTAVLAHESAGECGTDAGSVTWVAYERPGVVRARRLSDMARLGVRKGEWDGLAGGYRFRTRDLLVTSTPAENDFESVFLDFDDADVVTRAKCTWTGETAECEVVPSPEAP